MYQLWYMNYYQPSRLGGDVINTCYIGSARPYRGSFKLVQACSIFGGTYTRPLKLVHACSIFLDAHTRSLELVHACSIFYKAYISQSHTLLFILSCAMVF